MLVIIVHLEMYVVHVQWTVELNSVTIPFRYNGIEIYSSYYMVGQKCKTYKHQGTHVECNVIISIIPSVYRTVVCS